MGVDETDGMVFGEVVELKPEKTRREPTIDSVEINAPVVDGKIEEESDLFKKTLGGKLVPVDIGLPV